MLHLLLIFFLLHLPFPFKFEHSLETSNTYILNYFYCTEGDFRKV